MSRDDYDIGYKKPPAQHQFPKGKSGNPRGRPPARTRNIDMMHILRQELDEKVKITEGGKTKTLRKRQVIAKRFVMNAVSGKMKNIRQLFEYFPPERGVWKVIAYDSHGNLITPTREEQNIPPPLSEGRRDKSLKTRRPRVNSGSIKDLIKKELHRKVQINENRNIVEISMACVIIKTLAREAMKGNSEAINIIDEYFPDVDVGVLNLTPNFGDRKIITREEDLLKVDIPEEDLPETDSSEQEE